MNIGNIKKVHIIGIGGCASSAIGNFLIKKNIIVTGSERKFRSDLNNLSDIGIKIFYSHSPSNLYFEDKKPDVVLYSPAVMALDSNNPEILEARKMNISLSSWQTFIGTHLNSMNMTGVTVSGSEGKGTTAGILTMILKETEYDPLSILGAKLKNIYPK